MSPPEKYIKQLHGEPHLRNFLHSLYSLESKRAHVRRLQLLLGATIQQLDFLIVTLQEIMRKNIFVLGDPHGHELKRRRQIPYLTKHFADEKKVSALLRGSKQEKIDALKPINSFHQLLWLMFNRKP